MRYRKRVARLVGAASGLAWIPVCSAQTLQPAVLVATGAQTGGRNLECAITASPATPHEMLVGWQVTYPTPLPVKVWYSVSLNSGVSFTAPAQLYLACTESVQGCCTVRYGDPMIGSSTLTGESWIGSIMFPSTIVMARRQPGSTTLTNYAQVIPCAEPDKCFLAVGPWPSGTHATEAVYVGYNVFGTGGELQTAYAQDILPSGSQWQLQVGQPGAPTVVRSDPVPTAPRAGTGAFPVVIQSGPLAGRLILGSNQFLRRTAAEVTWSAVGGGGNAGDWELARVLEQYQPAGSPPVAIRGVGDTEDPLTVPIPGFVRANSMPSVSGDPTNPSNVVVAFAGRVDANLRNLDLFVAWSSTTGSSFPLDQIFHLTDDLLRIPGEPPPLEEGSDEWHGSIRIDPAGGVNLVFLRTIAPEFVPGTTTKTAPEDTQVTIRYARWPSIQALAAGQQPFLADMKLQDGVTTAVSEAFGGPGFDYIMLTAPSCQHLYIAWPCNHAGSPGGTWDMYVTAVALNACPPADVDANSIVDVTDALLFPPAYVAGAPLADLDHNGAITPADCTLFWESYACRCTPP